MLTSSVAVTGTALAATTPATTNPAPTPPSALWSSAYPATSPPPLAYSAAAYDSDTRTLVLFGGVEPNGTLSDDTWVWDGTNWTDFPNSQPGAREMASMAFDPTLHQLILFGGQGNNGTLLDDTWAWNGQQWTQLDRGGTAPSPRDGAAISYDSSGALVLFGGTGDTPVTGSSTTTTGVTSATVTSAAAPGAETVLGDTWQWTGSSWTQGPAAGPPARSGAQMAYDSATGTTVLFSGDTTPAGSGTPALAPDTWTWNGAAWSQQPTATAPPARSGAVFDDDPALGGPLLLAGAGASGSLDDAWLWTSQGWVQARGGGSPVPQAESAGAFDAATPAFVLFGGIGSGGSMLAGTELVTASFPTATAPTAPPRPTPTTTTTAPTAGGKPVPTSPTTAAPPKPTTVTPTSPQTTAPTSTTPAVPRPQSLTLVASVHTVRRGATVQLSGSGFRPGTMITITFHSTPALLGHTLADASGSFSATVAVPRSAVPGQHHLEAEGLAPSGAPTDLVAAVFVLGPIGSHGPTALQTAVMVALALLIPGATWAAMSGSGWWRRRRAAVAD